MQTIKKCFKEWNAIIEALGQGKQTIVIRTYVPNSKEFLLYPTFSYARKKDYIEAFKEEEREFVAENAMPKETDKTIEIKYFARVHKVGEMSPKSTRNIDDQHIWNEKHVKDYLKGKKAKVWVLRVYKLKKPYMAKKTKGMLYANLENGVDITGAEPVINESDFKRM